MKILIASFVLFGVLFVQPVVSLADETAEDTSQIAEMAEIADDAPDAPAEEWSEPQSDGKTMAEFVDEALQGKKRHFTDEDTMAVMRASRAVKGTDRELARKLEKIAGKISNL